MRSNLFTAAILGLLLLAGCQSSDLIGTSSAQPKAQCLVCKMNADLACVDLDSTQKNPTYLYNEKTYSFCSDECKTKFVKNPEKYVAKQ